MKLFILFVFLCYAGGLVLWKASPRLRSLLIVAASLLLTGIYFYFDRIY